MTRSHLLPMFAILLVVLGRSAQAHETVCTHTHEEPFSDGVIICSEPNTSCGDRLICKTKQHRTRGWCGCIRTNKDSCLLLAVEQLEPDSGGIPNEGDVIVYTAVLSPLNVGELITDSDQVVAEYGPGDAHFEGAVTLSFGEFGDPTAIPVTIVDMFFTLPGGVLNGQPTGTHVIYLLDIGIPPTLIYDADQQTLNTLGPEGIEVYVDTDLMQGLPTKVNLQAEIDADGAMVVLVQAVQVLPCDGDFDDDGDVDFADLLSMLSSWGPCGVCAQDINGDGIVGFADLLVVLAAWGDCP